VSKYATLETGTGSNLIYEEEEDHYVNSGVMLNEKYTLNIFIPCPYGYE
jgi:hypothetical protein